MKLILKTSRLFIFLLPVFLLARQPTARAKDYTLEEIHAAWRNRQDQVRSAHFRWVETHTIPRGSYGQKGPEFYPPEDTSHEVESELFISGNMVRFEWRGLEWREEVKGFMQKACMRASDGKVSRSLFSSHIDDISEQLYPIVFVKNQLYHEDVNNPQVEIPIFSVRALAPGIGCAGVLDRTITATSAPRIVRKELNGSPQAVIEQQFGKHVREVWVDPAKDFAISKYVLHLHGRRVYQIAASYKVDSHIGWVPAMWQIDRWIPTGSRTDVPRADKGVSATLLTYEINPALNIQVFRPEPDPGTLVVDLRGDGKEYLVKDDGVIRPIMESERDRAATYEELMSTDVGKAGLYRNRWTADIWWSIGIICVAILSGFVVWLRRSHWSPSTRLL